MHLGPTLQIDLSAVAENYRFLRAQLKSGACAAVVKADAYGLGMASVAPALAKAGCETFFVATLDEGIALRKLLTQAPIYIFHGVYKGEEKEFVAHRLVPVLNSMEQIALWAKRGPAALHIDTGMCRLGVSEAEAATLNGDWQLVMSHLACAHDPQHPLNAVQQKLFDKLSAKWKAPRSLSNSSGIFLSHDYHYDLARPGCSLYGIAPNDGQKMKPVATLSAPILQVHEVSKPMTVGYRAAYTAQPGSRIATVQIGYADGYLRALTNKGVAFVGGVQVPVVGVVSMDMVALDVSKVAQDKLGMAEFMNEHYTVDDLAAAMGTIGYEVLTRMGNRIRRVYV